MGALIWHFIVNNNYELLYSPDPDMALKCIPNRVWSKTVPEPGYGVKLCPNPGIK